MIFYNPMTNNDNRNDRIKKIDLTMEEYKVLRAEIVALIQNRNQLIVFGFAGLVTLMSVGVTIFSSSLSPMEFNKTKTIQYGQIDRESVLGNTKNNEITKPYSIVEKNKTENKTTIYEQRKIISAIVFIVFIPISCMYISYFWVRNTRHIFFISNYIANNIELKINLFYLKNEREEMNNELIMPLNWEVLMCTRGLPKDEFAWFVLTYASIAISSVIGGTIILLSYDSLTIIPGLLVTLVYLIFVRNNIDGLEEIRSIKFINKMREKISFKEFEAPKNSRSQILFNNSLPYIIKIYEKITPQIGLPNSSLDHSRMITWKKSVDSCKNNNPENP